MLLILYQYIFFVIYKKYVKWGDDTPGLYAIQVITILQVLFTIGIVYTVVRLFSFNLYIDNMYGAYLYFILMTCNYWYIYKKVGKLNIIINWEEESASRRKKMGILMALHFVVSFGLFALAVALRK